MWRQILNRGSQRKCRGLTNFSFQTIIKKIEPAEAVEPGEKMRNEVISSYLSLNCVNIRLNNERTGYDNEELRLQKDKKKQDEELLLKTTYDER